jgi:hypothetical protein
MNTNVPALGFVAETMLACAGPAFADDAPELAKLVQNPIANPPNTLEIDPVLALRISPGLRARLTPPT